MKSVKQAFLVLAAAVASVSMSAGVSLGQQRVGADGHALDVNNRVGSGGVNNTSPKPQNLSEQVLTGNVTGNAGWAGRLPFVASNSLRINNLAGSQIDSFIARSAGVPGSSFENYGSGYRPYYGSTTTAVAPMGFVQNNGGNGYSPAPPPTAQPQDLRLNLGIDTSIPSLPAPGQINLPGQVDPTAGLITASNLYGIRQWTPEEQAQQSQSMAFSQGPVGPNQQALAQQDQIQLIRQQLAGTNATATGVQPLPANNAQGPLSPLTVGPGTTALNAASVAPVANDPSTGQGDRRELPLNLLPPGQQSPQYQQLIQKMKDLEANGGGKTDEQANRDFLSAMQQIKALRAQQQQENVGKPAPVAPGAPATNPSSVVPARPVAPAYVSQPVTPLNQASKPVPIKSIGADVKSPALAELLTKAEDQTRHQQYSKAIESFNEAGKAAPNNPMIVIGRSHAELGGEYYRQAEADIRYAFTSNHELLLAQFSLADLYGTVRLGEIVKNLSDKAAESPTNPTPDILLAYISYNSGGADKSLAYLDEADKRGGGKDELVGLMKKYWALSPTPPATQPTRDGGANIPLNLTPSRAPVSK